MPTAASSTTPIPTSGPTTAPIREYTLNKSSGSTANDSCDEYDGTVEGTASRVAGHNFNALDLNGSNNCINIGTPDTGGSSFTISAWLYRHSSAEQMIMARDRWGQDI